jgi:replicative DNA helicase
LDAEESVLGAMLLSDRAIDAVAEHVTAADFYRASHGTIYTAALALHNAGEPVDAITVSAALERDGHLDGAALSRERLHELSALTPAAGNAAHYAAIVRETALRRRLIVAGESIAAVGRSGDGDEADMVAAAEGHLAAVERRSAAEDFVPAADIAHELVQHMSAVAATGAQIVGLPTGFRDIDRATSGLHPGNLVVIAGRPAMGKSGMMMTIVENIALHEHKDVGVFSYEMNRRELAQRLTAITAFVPLDQIITPTRLDTDAWAKVMAAADRIAKAPLHINDTKTLTMLDVRSQARRLKRRHPGLALIVVDYIQLMKHGAKHERRELEVSAISRELKLMAAELDVPVIALSQLSRGVESRHDKRPLLSDLRESGGIEQDADVVMLLYRGEYYFPEKEEVMGVAEVDIAKQRNGPTGMRRLAFVARYARFSDMAPEGV